MWILVINQTRINSLIYNNETQQPQFEEVKSCAKTGIRAQFWNSNSANMRNFYAQLHQTC